MFKRKSPTISFTPTRGLPLSVYPQPAKKFVPEWYRITPSYLGDGKKTPPTPGASSDNTKATVKRCVPVFDAITSGYMLLLEQDIFVSFDDQGRHLYTWKDGDFGFHSFQQLPYYPLKVPETMDEVAPKFMTSFSIKVPKGYSVMYVPPMHREAKFEVLPGIVDADQHHTPINLPFQWIDTKWEGMLEAGTPIAQVIPFKRESWKMEVSKDNTYHLKSKHTLLNVFYDAYRKNMWTKKEFN